ncbi:MAG: hypothetical protein LBT40_00615 [Deltaproteobacteria bacterium]|jgi:putative transcriptional regulator|nr:hypothetical protein [Deltaproteobacteria bacterium]
MAYEPIEVDRENLTIMGVKFPDLETLESMSGTIGSIMYEGFEPTARRIEVLRDYCAGAVSLPRLVAILGDNIDAG